MKPADVCLAVMVAVIWGLAFVASRIALDEFSPALMTTLRFAIAALPCLFLRKPDVYVAPLGAGMNIEAARLARELRRHDLVVELGEETFRLKKSFEAATKAGAKYILIVGENEAKSGAFALKNLATGEQVSVPRADLPLRIQRSE